MKKILRYGGGLIILIALLMAGCDIVDDDVSPEDEDPRTKFLGAWSVNETCSKQIYSVEIKEDPANTSQVLIENFANPGNGDPAVGIVTDGKITLDPFYEIGSGWKVSGQGEMINSKKMSWEYELVIAGTYYQCTATYAK